MVSHAGPLPLPAIHALGSVVQSRTRVQLSAARGATFASFIIFVHTQDLMNELPTVSGRSSPPSPVALLSSRHHPIWLQSPKVSPGLAFKKPTGRAAGLKSTSVLPASSKSSSRFLSSYASILSILVIDTTTSPQHTSLWTCDSV